MARDKQTADEVVWSSVQELFDQGDPAFVDQLRRVTDAEKLGKFGGAWLKDRRPASRRLMLEYLGRPLNAFRHEALVKRLFKKAEQAGDDEVMAHFLVLFDRSVRRVRKNRRFTEYRTVKTEAEAKALLKQWTAQGYEGVNYYRSGRQWYVYGYHTEEVFGLPSHS
ncbi:MAG TPA: hypothetical protein VKD72_34985, partial [Gemmataceae bacterium]|nr:hypothetical protein [Gemmataceae bacterium]